MPIIPSNWSGEKIVNATGMNSDSGFPVYKFAKTVKNIEITDSEAIIDLISFVEEPINREVNLEIKSGKAKLFWKNFDNSYQQINLEELSTKDSYNDSTLGQLGLAIEIIEPTILNVWIRWDKDIDFNIYSNDPPTPQPELITVVDNSFYVDETLGATYTDTITCYAYFPDNATQPGTSWHILYAVNCEGFFQIFQGVYANPENVFPSQNNPFIFNFYPPQVLSGYFELYRTAGEEDYRLILKIVSFNPESNTFIIDFP